MSYKSDKLAFEEPQYNWGFRDNGMEKCDIGLKPAAKGWVRCLQGLVLIYM